MIKRSYFIREESQKVGFQSLVSWAVVETWPLLPQPKEVSIEYVKRKEKEGHTSVNILEFRRL
jgi:hypothetical protein